LDVDRVGDNVVARTALGRPPRLVLAGHTDTVPVNGNERARRDGDVLWGLGSADMKSGLAVFCELAESVSDPVVDVTYVFYVCEEVAREYNGLTHLFATRPELLVGDAAILGEPTGARVEAGCQGAMRLALDVVGERAHTARPWMGRNAIHRLGPVLDRVAAYRERRPVLDGCEYREALQAVGVEGGVAGNVVPDRARLVLNHRFAPDRSAAEAEAHVLEVVGPLEDGDSLTVLDAAGGARPSLDHPLLASLVAGTGEPPRAKLGWTDVAFFAERGIPATNFGPGDPNVAHTAGEHVTLSEIEAVHAALLRLLTARGR
jgi:succinyl-diaminopimelate desuccinylase